MALDNSTHQPWPLPSHEKRWKAIKNIKNWYETAHFNFRLTLTWLCAQTLKLPSEVEGAELCQQMTVERFESSFVLNQGLSLEGLVFKQPSGAADWHCSLNSYCPWRTVIKLMKIFILLPQGRSVAQWDTPWATLLASDNLIQITSLPRGSEGSFCVFNPNLMKRNPQVFQTIKPNHFNKEGRIQSGKMDNTGYCIHYFMVLSCPFVNRSHCSPFWNKPTSVVSFKFRASLHYMTDGNILLTWKGEREPGHFHALCQSTPTDNPVSRKLQNPIPFLRLLARKKNISCNITSCADINEKALFKTSIGRCGWAPSKRQFWHYLRISEI